MAKNSRVEKGKSITSRNLILSNLFFYLIMLVVLMIILMTGFVSAASLNTTGDVAYIYKSKLKVDQNIVALFHEMNLSVDLIDERYMPKSFSSYKFIFAGDERFSKTIPVDDYNSIVTNYYFGQDWGLTDYDGVSNLASTSPLSVRKGDQVVQVYTQAKYPNGISIPYYYLGDENKVPAMQKAAGTYTGNEYDFGDVISYANAGTHLINGKNAKGNICFYGIVASKYWTEEAKQMFMDCVNFVGTTCSQDTDCPADKVGAKYCKDSDVYQDSTDYFCSMAGSVKSQCDSNVFSNLIETCAYGCANGNCLPQCTKDSDCLSNQICSNNQCVNITCKTDMECDDSNDHTSDKCLNPGTIQSSCSHTPISCLNNLECGTDGFSGNLFCQNKDVVINFITYTCNNPGTIQSSCSNNTIVKLNKTCADACNNGACVAITCYNDSQCDDSNIKTIDKCLNPGTGQSSCVHMPINCSSNNDCGTNGLINGLFCLEGSIFQNFLTYTCNNPGTANATCSSSTNALLNKTCAYGCANGNCLPQCTKDSDCLSNQICSNNQCVNITCKTDMECDDNKSSTIDKCINPGTVQSYCENTFVKCNKNSECGTDGFSGDLFCLSDDSYQNFITYKCNNPGTGSSSCTTTTTPILKQNCNILCSNGNCIGCLSDSGCGTDGFVGDKYCKGKDVYQDFKDFSCTNAGQSNSQCSSNTVPKLIKSCSDTCFNGECKNIVCENNNDCDDSNAYTIDECNNAGTTSSFCSNTPVNCLSNNDCGITGFGGQEFCIGADVFKNYQKSNCVNPGTRLSYCDISIEQQFIVDCGIGKTCSNGICMPVKCNSNAECGTNKYLNQLFCMNNNVFDKFITYTCNNPGTAISSCSSSTQDKSIKNCAYGCLDGSCLPQCTKNTDCAQGQVCLNNQCISIICSKDSDCNDNNDHTVDTCLNPGTVQSSCSHTPINCNSNAECGTNGYINGLFCQSGNLFQNFLTYTCNNPGTALSSCSTSTNALLKQTCSQGQTCSDGQCKDVACEHDSDCGTDGYLNQLFCKNNNSFDKFRKYTCNNPGTANAVCSNALTDVLKQTCAYGCANGLCNNNNCVDVDQDSYDTCNPGTPGDDGKPKDCNDNNANVHPNAVEVCNSIDDDCDGLIDEGGVCACACYQNSDCGANHFLNQLFCKNNNVFDKFITYTCNNPGTPNAMCSSSTSDVLKQTCAQNQICSNGQCTDINIPCSSDGQCNDANAHTFDKCNNPGTPQSFCSHIPIVCLNNGECGTDGFVNGLFCQNNNVVQNFLSFTCENPGTIQSSCNSQITPQLNKICSQGQTCSDGQCKDVACEHDSDCGTDGYLNQLFCKNNNSFDKFRKYTCNNPGTANAVCSNALTDVLKQTCAYGCTNGVCNNNNCVDQDSDSYDTCNPGTPGDDGKPKDCNDNNANVHPNAVEVCNSIDDDCDGLIDEGNVCECYKNSDCGTDHFLNQEFCKDGSIFDKFMTYTCNNPGTPSAMCSSSIIDKLKQTCDENQICSTGTEFNPNNGLTITIGNGFEEIYNFVKSKDASLGTCALSGKGNAMLLANAGWSTGSCSLLDKSQLDATATKICNLAGYKDVNTYDSYYSADGGRCNWFTPANDCLWYWTGSSWQYSNANNGINKFGQRWITKLTCINKLPGPGDIGVTDPTCVNIVCSKDSDCNDNNAGTKDKCINPGTAQSYCTNTVCPTGGQNSNNPSPAQCAGADWNIGLPSGVTCSGSVTTPDSVSTDAKSISITGNTNRLRPDLTSLNQFCKQYTGDSSAYATYGRMHNFCTACNQRLAWFENNQWTSQSVCAPTLNVQIVTCATGCSNPVC